MSRFGAVVRTRLRIERGFVRAEDEKPEPEAHAVSGEGRAVTPSMRTAQPLAWRSHHVPQNHCGLNSKKPNRNDGAKHGQAGNRPARHVNRTVGFGCVHHRVMPMGHISLLKRFPAKHALGLEPGACLGLEPGACPGLDPGWRPVRVKKTRQIKNLEPHLDSIEMEKAPEIASGRYVSASGGKVQIG